MKRKKTPSVFLALALALTMCLGSTTTAFAAPGPISGSEGAPAQAVIAKELKMADGTVTPAATFTFTFAKKDVDGDSSTAAQSSMPGITSKSVTFSGTESGISGAGVKTVTGETVSLFDGVTWPHAGVYTYTVTETGGTYSASSSETVTYSLAEYEIAVYVANNAAGTGLYVAAIGTTIVKTDDGTAGTGKTDPGTSSTITGASRAMTFTNSYVKKNGGTDPTDPTDQTLAISKTVAGDYGDHTKYFGYGITVTQSALSSGTTYKGYVVENVAGTATVVTSSANGVIAGSDAHGSFINFPSGTAITVNLKSGQTLAFVDNEVGSSYVALESATVDYTPSIALVVNGASSTIPGTINTSLSTGTQIIGDNANSAGFTNTYKTVTPTGISLESLPFIMMIILAAGALVVFVVVKSRKKLQASKS